MDAMRIRNSDIICKKICSSRRLCSQMKGDDAHNQSFWTYPYFDPYLAISFLFRSISDVSYVNECLKKRSFLLSFVFVRSFACSLVRSSVHLFVHSFVHSFICSFFHPFVDSLVIIIMMMIHSFRQGCFSAIVSAVINEALLRNLET